MEREIAHTIVITIATRLPVRVLGYDNGLLKDKRRLYIKFIEQHHIHSHIKVVKLCSRPMWHSKQSKSMLIKTEYQKITDHARMKTYLMAMYRSALIAVRLRIEAVQTSMSSIDQSKQICGPNIHMPSISYEADNGKTRTDNARSATAKFSMKQLVGLRSLLRRQKAAITKLFPRIATNIKRQKMVLREIVNTRLFSTMIAV